MRAWGGGGARKRVETAVRARADDVENPRVTIGVVVGEGGPVLAIGPGVVVRLPHVVVLVEVVLVVGPDGGIVGGEGVPGDGQGAGVAQEGGEKGEQEGLQDRRNLDAGPPGVARACRGVRGRVHEVDIGRYAGRCKGVFLTKFG